MTGWTDEARAAALAARAGKAKAAGDASHHQLKIAADTLRMPDAMAGVMGGPTKDQARAMADDHAAAQALSGGHPKSEAVPVHGGAAGRMIPIAPGGKAVQGGALGFLGSLHNAPGVAKDKWGWSEHDYNGFRLRTNGTSYGATNPKTGRKVSLKRVTS